MRRQKTSTMYNNDRNNDSINQNQNQNQNRNKIPIAVATAATAAAASATAAAATTTTTTVYLLNDRRKDPFQTPMVITISIVRRTEKSVRVY